MSFDFYKKVIGGTSATTFSFGRKFILGGSGGVEPTYKDVILSGVSPLALTKAKADGLNYVKAFGKCEQDNTEYLSSVTLSGGTEQTNLPSGYTQLRYVQNTASTTKVNTGIIPQVGDEIEIRFITPYTAATSNYLLQSRAGTNASIFGVSGSQTGKTIILSWGAGNSLTSNITREYNHVYVVKASAIGTTLTLYVKDVTAGTEDTVTGTITTQSDAETPYFIWGNTSQYLAQITPVYYARIVNNGETRLSYVAAKDSNDSASFYDLVNNTFITNFDGTITGSEDLATPTPDTPINIVSNNGVIKVRRNLIDLNAVTDGYYYDSQGVYSALSNTRVTDYIPVEAGQSITIYFKSLSTVSNLNVRINIFNSNKVWQSQEVLQLLPNTGDTKIITPTANGYIRVSGNYSGNAIVDWNTAKTVYGEYTVDTIDNAIGQIYTEGTQEVVTDSLNNSATAEMLLNVTITNNYTDVQEILTGAITRNTAIKVLDGTEGWVINSGDYNFYRLNSAVNYSGSLVSGFPCTHFEPVSIASTSNNQGIRINSNSLFLRYDNLYPATSENLPLFKQWLADQYANGTPVILVYPLATSTTESVTGQTLVEQPITQTAGSIPNLSITVDVSSNPTPTHQKAITCNNGVLKVSANILNRNDLEGGYLLTDEGQRGSSNNNWILTNFIKVKPNTNYIFDFVSGGDSVYRRVCGYSSNDYNSFTELLIKKQRPVTEGERFSEPFTTSATTNYIRVSTYKADTNIQITEGTVAIPYRAYGEVYADGTVETITDSKNNSATAEMLLSVDSYKDVQSLLDGAITRNIGIKVFDGTESWSRTDARVALVLGDNSADETFEPFCTHYKGCPASMSLGSLPDNGCKFSNASNTPILIKDTVHNTDINTWKSYLAQEYANGTPVILVYPLATSTTESVTEQTLSTKSGTNTITATGSIEGLELEVSFKQQL